MYGAFGSRASLANVTKLHVNLGSLANFVNIDILAGHVMFKTHMFMFKII